MAVNSQCRLNTNLTALQNRNDIKVIEGSVTATITAGDGGLYVAEKSIDITSLGLTNAPKVISVVAYGGYTPVLTSLVGATSTAITLRFWRGGTTNALNMTYRIAYIEG